MEDFNKRLYDYFNYFTQNDEVISKASIVDLFNSYIESSNIKYLCNSIDLDSKETKIAGFNPGERKILFNYENNLKFYKSVLNFTQNINILYSLLHELSHVNQAYTLCMIDNNEIDYNKLNSISKLECILNYHSYYLNGISFGNKHYLDYSYSNNMEFNRKTYDHFHDLFPIERLAIIDGYNWFFKSIYKNEEDKELKKLYKDYIYSIIYKYLISEYNYINLQEENPIKYFFNVTALDDPPKEVNELMNDINKEEVDTNDKLRIGLPVKDEEYKKAYELYKYYLEEYKNDLVLNSKIKRKINNYY